MALLASLAVPERLPFSVMRAVVKQHRTSPPGMLRTSAREQAERLARLPASVWALPIDWKTWAAELDAMAWAPPPTATPREVKDSNQRVAAALRRAAHALRDKHQIDPSLGSAFYAAEKLSPGLEVHVSKGHNKTLSEFLGVLREWFEGNQLETYGLHFRSGPKGKGPNAAAIDAAERVSEMFRKACGKPHWDQVEVVVQTYHPAASAKNSDSHDTDSAAPDLARAVNQRFQARKKRKTS